MTQHRLVAIPDGATPQQTLDAVQRVVRDIAADWQARLGTDPTPAEDSLAGLDMTKPEDIAAAFGKIATMLGEAIADVATLAAFTDRLVDLHRQALLIPPG